MRKMFSNSIKKVGTGICNPVNSSGLDFVTSSKAMHVLVASIIIREPLSLWGHSCLVTSDTKAPTIMMEMKIC